MRKLIVSMNLTLDGFIAGPDCELDWHFDYWNNEMLMSISDQLSHADTILLGRVTYRAMAKYWQYKANDLCQSREDIAFTDMMNSYNKIVFSKTLSAPEWNNSSLIKQSADKVIYQLKREAGRDMIIYGSGHLVSSLMKTNLIDEYVLWIHPVVIGRGIAFFNKLRHKRNLKLVKTKIFDCGVVILNYEVGSFR